MAARTFPPENARNRNSAGTTRATRRRPDIGFGKPLSSKDIVVERCGWASDNRRISHVESLISDSEVQGAVAAHSGHRLGVSSMAGEVVSGYHHRNAPIGVLRWVTRINHPKTGSLDLPSWCLLF